MRQGTKIKEGFFMFYAMRLCAELKRDEKKIILMKFLRKNQYRGNLTLHTLNVSLKVSESYKNFKHKQHKTIPQQE